MNFSERSSKASFTCGECNNQYNLEELKMEKVTVRSYSCPNCDHRLFTAHS